MALVLKFNFLDSHFLDISKKLNIARDDWTVDVRWINRIKSINVFVRPSSLLLLSMIRPQETCHIITIINPSFVAHFIIPLMSFSLISTNSTWLYHTKHRHRAVITVRCGNVITSSLWKQHRSPVSRGRFVLSPRRESWRLKRRGFRVLEHHTESWNARKRPQNFKYRNVELYFHRNKTNKPNVYLAIPMEAEDLNYFSNTSFFRERKLLDTDAHSVSNIKAQEWLTYYSTFIRTREVNRKDLFDDCNES